VKYKIAVKTKAEESIRFGDAVRKHVQKESIGRMRYRKWPKRGVKDVGASKYLGSFKKIVTVGKILHNRKRLEEEKLKGKNNQYTNISWTFGPLMGFRKSKAEPQRHHSRETIGNQKPQGPTKGNRFYSKNTIKRQKQRREKERNRWEEKSCGEMRGGEGGRV